MPKLQYFPLKNQVPKSNMWLNRIHEQKSQFLFPADHPKYQATETLLLPWFSSSLTKPAMSSPEMLLSPSGWIHV